MGLSLTKYLNLQQKVFDYFGYKENWKAIPIDDQRGEYWMLIGDGTSSTDKIVHSPEPFTKESIRAGSNTYSATLYTQRHLPKWVYLGEHFTMICVDTHTDDNKFLQIFTNSKRCDDEELMRTYLQHWG